MSADMTTTKPEIKKKAKKLSDSIHDLHIQAFQLGFDIEYRNNGGTTDMDIFLATTVIILLSEPFSNASDSSSSDSNSSYSYDSGSSYDSSSSSSD